MINLVQRKYFTDISEFEFRLGGQKRLVGTGSFGVVRLALHRGTNRVYAIKIMDIEALTDKTELKIMEREIQIHSQLDHPHIVKLWNTLLHDGKVYMIMEYAPNGNLFYHQNLKVRFSEPEAFKFFYQSAKAVEYLHLCDIIHRDIKPENILLDEAYNVKLCDFGWSAYDAQARRSTFCGTYEYMAPEMLINKSYDYRIDIWGLGILLYELLHGRAPFRGQNVEEIQMEMETGFDIKESLSEGLKDLIRRLLMTDPSERITLQQVMKHDWVLQMTEFLNSSLRNTDLACPQTLNSKISELAVSNCKSKKRHQKTESASQIHLPKDKSININFLINNYSMSKDKKTENETRCQPDSAKQAEETSGQSKPFRPIQKFKTATEESDCDYQAALRQELASGKKRKLQQNLRPEMQSVDKQLRKLFRRKSQDNIKPSHFKHDSVARIATEAQELKQLSKKKRVQLLPDEPVKKKYSSTANFKRLHARPM